MINPIILILRMVKFPFLENTWPIYWNKWHHENKRVPEVKDAHVTKLALYSYIELNL